MAACDHHFLSLYGKEQLWHSAIHNLFCIPQKKERSLLKVNTGLLYFTLPSKTFFNLSPTPFSLPYLLGGIQTLFFYYFPFLYSLVMVNCYNSWDWNPGQKWFISPPHPVFLSDLLFLFFGLSFLIFHSLPRMCHPPSTLFQIHLQSSVQFVSGW